MGKLFDWLFGKAEEIEEKAEALTKKVDTVTEIELVEEVIQTERFVDSETGKSYKTAGALKGAITRRKNKAKKGKGKKKTKKTKK